MTRSIEVPTLIIPNARYRHPKMPEVTITIKENFKDCSIDEFDNQTDSDVISLDVSRQESIQHYQYPSYLRLR